MFLPKTAARLDGAALDSWSQRTATDAGEAHFLWRLAATSTLPSGCIPEVDLSALPTAEEPSAILAACQHSNTFSLLLRS
jgi:hypothetical protein